MMFSEKVSLLGLWFCITLGSCTMDSSPNYIDWKIVTTLPQEAGTLHLGLAGPVAGILDDKLIIAGGANFPEAMPWEGGEKRYQKKLYIYQLGDKEGVHLLSTEEFTDSLAYCANAGDSKVFYSLGGERNGKATADVFRYSLQRDKVIREALQPLPFPLTNAAAALIGKHLYVVGGENEQEVSNKIFRLNREKKNALWEEIAVLPNPVSHSIVVGDGYQRLYVVGGRRKNSMAVTTFYDTVYEVDLPNRKVKQIASLPQALAAGTGIYYKGNLIIVGGDNAQTYHKVEELIMAAQQTDHREEREKIIEKKNDIQRNHPGFTRRVWCYSIKEKKWDALNDLEGESPVTTIALLYKNTVIIPSGEIRAGVRTPQILLGEIR